jgi:DNA-binding transcriptional LysR family regulator
LNDIRYFQYIAMMDKMLAMRVFVTAVAEGSLAAAGRLLDLSPAMAGRHLTALEEQLGARLLQRSTRQLVLTEAGERYYQRCRRLIDDMDDADREVADLDRSIRGTLRMSAPVTFASLQLGDTVAAYLAAHPGVSIELALTDAHVDLLAEGVDLAIRIGQLRDEHLTVRRIASCRMIACASPSYLQAHGTPATPADLTHHECLAFAGARSDGDWTFYAADGTAHVAAIHARLKVDNMDMLRAVALAGAGIVFGPGFAFAASLASGQLQPVLDGFKTTSLPIHAVYPTSRYIPRRVRNFVDALANDLNAEPGP